MRISLTVFLRPDVKIFDIRKGKFGFYDYIGVLIKGKNKFEYELSIRDGQIVYDLNGIVKICWDVTEIRH